MNNNQKYNIIIAVTLAILSIICFLLQIFTTLINSKMEEILINILQFIFSIGFTWFISKYLNYEQFVKSTKKYAISAYRRISDIGYITNRLSLKINKMLMKENCNQNNLLIIKEIVSDTQQILLSSVADWSEIIDEEISTINSIKELEKKRSKLELSHDINDNQEERKILDDQINNLKNKLPPELQYEHTSQINTDETLIMAANWLANKHIQTDGLRLQVVTGGNYGDYKSASELQKDTVFFIDFLNNGSDILNNDGIIIGRILNITPFEYNDFIMLLDFIFDARSLELKYNCITKEWNDDNDQMAYLEFTLLNDLKGIFEKYQYF